MVDEEVSGLIRCADMVDFAGCSPVAVVDRDSWLDGLVEEEIVPPVGCAAAVLESEEGEVV